MAYFSLLNTRNILHHSHHYKEQFCTGGEDLHWGIQEITTVLKIFRSLKLRALTNILKLANTETHFAFEKFTTHFTRQGMQLHSMNRNVLQHHTNNRKTIFSAVSCPNIIYYEEVLHLSLSITEQTCKNVVIHFPQIMVKL